jgi:hypothetical protein
LDSETIFHLIAQTDKTLSTFHHSTTPIHSNINMAGLLGGGGGNKKGLLGGYV